MQGRELDVLVLDEEPEAGSRNAISDNFLRVRVPETAPVNEWIKLRIVAVSEEESPPILTLLRS